MNSAAPKGKRALLIAAGGIVSLLVVLACVWAFLHFGKRISRVPSSAIGLTVNLDSSRDKVAVEVPGEFQVWYVEQGQMLQVRVVAESRSMVDGASRSHREQVNDASPLIYFDVNHSHMLDAGDRRYTFEHDGAVIAQQPDPSGNGVWLTVPTRAAGSLQRIDNKTEAVWNIPREEVTQSGTPADMSLDSFHFLSQKSRIYPGPKLFENVYRLIVSGASPTPVAPVPGLAPTPVHPGVVSAQAPVIRNFAVSPVSGDPRSSYRLQWQIEGAESADIQPGLGSVGASNQQIVNPHQPTHYVLTARNHVGTVTRDLTVTPASVPPPQIAFFLADAQHVAAGSQTALRWRVDGEVNDVRIEALGGGLPAQGNRAVTIERTTQYTLVAQGPGGAVSAQVQVQADALPVPVVSFSGHPQVIRAGQGVNLVWSVSDAENITVEPGIGSVSASGNITVHPSSTVRYRLIASGRGGTVSREVPVSVTRLPSASRGEIVWSGVVHGQILVTIDRDHADLGEVQGALPGEACILQLPANNKNISIASSPGPRNDYERIILRVKGNGLVRVAIEWVIQ